MRRGPIIQDGCMMAFCNNMTNEDDGDLEPLPLLQQPQNNTHMNNLLHLFTNQFIQRNPNGEPHVQDRSASTTEEAADSIDSLLANALNRISLQEREKAFEDVHGIARSQPGIPSSTGSSSNVESRPRQQKKKHAMEPVDGLDPNYVNSCLLELETLLATVMRKNRDNNISTAYAQAAELSIAYVQQRQLRTMFLQAEYFDISRAADRMLRFFELKKRLFGVEKLVQDITLDDLDENDMETLRAGGDGIVSSLSDSAGRPIVFFMNKLRKYQATENVHRAYFYVFMSLMELPAAQTKGIVSIYYVVNTDSPKSFNSELRMALPIYVTSNHLCTDKDATYYAARSLGALSLYQRARTRAHLGSHVECLYKLMSFGIPRTALPVYDDGKCMLDGHLLWIEQRRGIEASRREHQLRLKQHQTSQQAGDGRFKPCRPLGTSSSSCTTSTGSPSAGNMPTKKKGDGNMVVLSNSNARPNDVLFGRGKLFNENPGNIKFRRLVDAYVSKYEVAGKIEKTCIAEIIVKMVQESSGRFLAAKRKAKPSAMAPNNAVITTHGMVWEEVDHATARNKVAHAFRNRRNNR